MIYQLKTGTCIEMSLDTYLSLPDGAFEGLNMSNVGFFVSNPFHNSSLDNINTNDEILDFYAELDYLDNSEDLFEASLEDKINDEDFHDKDNI